MAFEKLNITAQFRKWALWSKGEKFIFKLKGFTHGEFKGKPTTNFLCEILEEVDFLDYKDNEIAVGSVLSLSLPTSLEDYIQEHEIGQVFSLEYMGKKMNKAGTDSYHTFDTGIDRNYGKSEGNSQETPAAEAPAKEDVDFTDL